jgi:hypothetical protein
MIILVAWKFNKIQKMLFKIFKICYIELSSKKKTIQNKYLKALKSYVDTN